jgi:hypothetical protein
MFNHSRHTRTRSILATAVSAAVICLCLKTPLAAQPEKQLAVLATSDTRVAMVPGPTAPQLLSLSGPDGISLCNFLPESLPAQVEIKGQSVPVAWKFQKQLSTAGLHHVDFVYRSASPRLELHWQWEARAGFGPLEHHITVTNLGSREIWLPLIDSLALSLDYNNAESAAGLRHFYVEKGADSPSAEGTHLADIPDGYQWIGRSSTYARPIPGQSREIIPIEIVYASNASQPGWYAGIEFSGRTRIALDRTGTSLKTVLGLDPDPGPYKTRLPGNHGSFESPTVFLGAFSHGIDGAGNQLRPWVRAALNNPLTWKDQQYPLTVNNSWGSGMKVDEAIALRMLHDSKALGLEMFHIDAGWFRNVGDWVPDPKKFPHGLAYIADEAHREGLRFGIWTDWTQAALSTEPGALNIRNPKVRDWMVTDLGPDWKPEEFKGQTIDIGVPAARDWAASEVKRIVESYHLDMLEHDGYLVAQGCVREDHPHAPPVQSTIKVTHDCFDFVSASDSTDVSYHAVRAYYRIYEQLRREHPGLLLEICNDGGRMVDFGSAAHGDYFSITDTYDPLSNRRAFYDTSHVLPAAMLESYVESWPVPEIANFRYMLRSGMMGWLTIMLDTTVWTPEQHEEARREIAIYKEKLRPLIREAQLYHVSDRPDGVHWDAAEYWDPARKTGVLYAFRGSIADESAHVFSLAGLDPGTQYKLHFEDASQPDREASGRELMADGLTITLEKPLTSELVFIKQKAAQN